MKNKSLVSINDFSKEEYIKILELAAEFEKNPSQNILKDYVIASLFFWTGGEAPDFLGDPVGAFILVVIQDVWRMTPFLFVIKPLSI